MAKPKVPDFTVVVDTREQLPYDFYTLERLKEKSTGRVVEEHKHPWNVVHRKLDTGDYSIEGYENIFTIERKSLSDYLGCIFTDRFDRELERMAEIPHPFLLIEASIFDLTMPERNNSAAHPNAILGKLASYPLKHNVQVITAGNRQGANYYARTLMKLFWDKFQEGELFSMKTF